MDYEDYYYMGEFMENASFTFEKDISYYWYTMFTEPLMMP